MNKEKRIPVTLDVFETLGDLMRQEYFIEILLTGRLDSCWSIDGQFNGQ